MPIIIGVETYCTILPLSRLIFLNAINVEFYIPLNQWLLSASIQMNWLALTKRQEHSIIPAGNSGYCNLLFERHRIMKEQTIKIYKKFSTKIEHVSGSLMINNAVCYIYFALFKSDAIQSFRIQNRLKSLNSIFEAPKSLCHTKI